MSLVLVFPNSAEADTR